MQWLRQRGDICDRYWHRNGEEHGWSAIQNIRDCQQGRADESYYYAGYWIGLDDLQAISGETGGADPSDLYPKLGHQGHLQLANQMHLVC